MARNVGILRRSGRPQSAEKECLDWASWRREWDSNPRYARAYNGFRDRPVRPLRHPSTIAPRIGRGPAYLATDPGRRKARRTRWPAAPDGVTQPSIKVIPGEPTRPPGASASPGPTLARPRSTDQGRAQPSPSARRPGDGPLARCSSRLARTRSDASTSRSRRQSSGTTLGARPVPSWPQSDGERDPDRALGRAPAGCLRLTAGRAGYGGRRGLQRCGRG
jgi:hypothetical protein